MTWIVTFTGRKFDLFDPQPDQVAIEDIAHALAHICRFGGHTVEHYSVAQHSTAVAKMVDERRKMPALTLAALLHDAAEAYIGDIVRPLKEGIAEAGKVRELEAKIQAAVAACFGFDPHLFEHPEIKRADTIALMTEKRDVLSVPASAIGWPGDWPPPSVDYIRPRNAVEAKADFSWFFWNIHSEVSKMSCPSVAS